VHVLLWSQLADLKSSHDRVSQLLKQAQSELSEMHNKQASRFTVTVRVLTMAGLFLCSYDGASKLQGMKLQGMKMADQFAEHEIARHEITRQEIAGHENDGPMPLRPNYGHTGLSHSESANYFNLRRSSYRSSDRLPRRNAKSILSLFCLKRSPLVCSFVSCYFIPAFSCSAFSRPSFSRPAFSAPPVYSHMTGWNGSDYYISVSL